MQHKTTVHVGCITLIAHRTSDTEKKNILSVFEKSPLKLSPLKSIAFTIKLTTNHFSKYVSANVGTTYSIYACFVLTVTIVFMGKLTVAWYICAFVKLRTNIKTSNVTFSH